MGNNSDKNKEQGNNSEQISGSNYTNTINTNTQFFNDSTENDYAQAYLVGLKSMGYDNNYDQLSEKRIKDAMVSELNKMMNAEVDGRYYDVLTSGGRASEVYVDEAFNKFIDEGIIIPTGNGYSIPNNLDVPSSYTDSDAIENIYGDLRAYAEDMGYNI